MNRAKNAENVNNCLLELGKKWCLAFDEQMRAMGLTDWENVYSSPFFAAVSPEEWEKDGRGLVMFLGEEARNWWFDKTTKMEDIQAFAIQYIREQLGHLPAKKNRSPFWNVIRAISKSGYSIAWNNLDKYHRRDPIKKSTLVLNRNYYEEEMALHRATVNGKTLLLAEIEQIAPDYIICLGKTYRDALISALMLPPDTPLPTPELQNGKTVVDITAYCTTLTASNPRIKVLWICHPAAFSFRGLYRESVANILEKLETN